MMGTFLYGCFFSFLSIVTPQLVATIFHFFLSLNTIPYTIFYSKRSSFLVTELMSFSLKALLKYFVF